MLVRALVAEFIGTFALVYGGVGAMVANSALGAEAKMGPLGVALTFGLIVMVMVYALGPVSAAHLNPAVTLALSVTKRFPWKFAVPYWIAQFLGAVVAAFFHWAFLPEAVNVDFGATTLKGVSEGTGLVLEVILTFFLVLVIMAVATDRRAPAAITGLAIGMTVAIGGLVGGPFTGGSMNPARSLGPALFAGIGLKPEALTQFPIYLIGPCLGAVIAGLVYEYLRSPEYAKGAPQELLALARGAQEGA